MISKSTSLGLFKMLPIRSWQFHLHRIQKCRKLRPILEGCTKSSARNSAHSVSPALPPQPKNFSSSPSKSRMARISPAEAREKGGENCCCADVCYQSWGPRRTTSSRDSISMRWCLLHMLNNLDSTACRMRWLPNPREVMMGRRERKQRPAMRTPKKGKCSQLKSAKK